MEVVVGVTIAFLCVCAFDLFVAWRSFSHKNMKGKYLGLTCICSFIVTLSYLISLFVRDYFTYSLLSSIYFAGIDMTLLTLMRFVRHFVKNDKDRFEHAVPAERISRAVLLAYGAFDVAMLLLNPIFPNLVVRFVARDTVIAHYSYDMMPLFQLHLGFTYLLVVLILVQLVRCVMRVPKMYRGPYTFAILTIVAIVGINAFYLFVPGPQGLEFVDYSLLGYSLGVALFYWNCFEYSSRGLMRRYQSWVFSNVDQGIVLFDYTNTMILQNGKAEEMLPAGTIYSGISVNDFLSNCGIRKSILDDTVSRSVQCYVGGRPTRCDYSVQVSESGEVLARLFVLSQLSTEFDLLTGFQSWEFFKHNGNAVFPPTGDNLMIALFDINSLSDINKQCGHENGDRAIQMLSEMMRAVFPPETYFVRSREAHLAAICQNTDAAQVEAWCVRVHEESEREGVFDVPITIQHAIVERHDRETAVELMRVALQTIHTKKLMDKSSVHSELLSSLVQALEQCDSDTRAHVYRTQRMGEKLGRRIGLTEQEQSNLALLAILHDIGKIGIPLDILNKPGKLSADEWNVIKSHVRKGYQIAINSQELAGIAEMILYHHERWDGNGYPDGLSKESIPLLSRIISVVDAYDAMTNDRSYRKALPIAAARQELRRFAGTQFDPRIVSEFLQMLEEQDKENGIVVQEIVPTEQTTEQQWSAENPHKLQELRVHPLKYSRYVLDKDQHIVEIDETFERLTGYTRADIEKGSMTQSSLIFEEDREAYYSLVQEQLSRSSAAYIEHRICRKDGTVAYVFCFGRTFYDSATREERTEIIVNDSMDSYTVQTMADIEHNKAQRRMEQWENKYRHDSLTGLLGHEAFENDVEMRLLSERKRMMMLMMDVDRFKEYNDTFGHRSGDEFLIMVGQLLADSMGEEDLACRMGGDEFAALLVFEEGTDDQTMLRRAQQMCDKLNMMLRSHYRGNTSMSMGGAFSEASGGSFDKLYEAADQALYRAKNAGRARFSV